MLSWGEMNLGLAATAEENAKARAAVDQAQKMQMENDLFLELVRSGQVENPDELIQMFQDRTGGTL
jgi:hypothetical protein